MVIVICDSCQCFVRRELLELNALERCRCGEPRFYDICQICITLRYVLNFSVWKICIDEEKLTDRDCHILDWNSFLRNLLTDTFFVFNRITNFKEVRLENPDNVLHLLDIVGS